MPSGEADVFGHVSASQVYGLNGYNSATPAPLMVGRMAAVEGRLPKS